MYALLCLAAVIAGEVATSVTLLLISVAFAPLFGGIVLWDVGQRRSQRKMGSLLGRKPHFSNIWAGEFVPLPPKLAAVSERVGCRNNVDQFALIKNQVYANASASAFKTFPPTLQPLPRACHT